MTPQVLGGGGRNLRRRVEERKLILAVERPSRGGWVHRLAAEGGLQGGQVSGVRRGQPPVGGSAWGRALTSLLVNKDFFRDSTPSE